MLYEFIAANHEELVARTRRKVEMRPGGSGAILEYGVPLFLTQLAGTLRRENTLEPFPPNLIGQTATKHGEELMSVGYTVSQVVHVYGDVCQAVTELAVEQKAVISNEEFHTLNRCLDTAIAEAVTEFGRLERESSGREEVVRLGALAHELRNQVQVALFSLQALKSGKVGVGGSTGALLGRSLLALRGLIDSALSEVRLEGGLQQLGPVSLPAFMKEVSFAAEFYAEHRKVDFSFTGVEPTVMVQVDTQLLYSAVMNLLQNAFKYTNPAGRVSLRTRLESGRVLIEVEDECGGLSETTDLFRTFGDRRKNDRSGLGLGLFISRRAVVANGGEIRAQSLPGKGCIFTIDLPHTLAAESRAPTRDAI